MVNYYKYDGQKNPFPRPWMTDNCAASGGNSAGRSALKGLVAGAFTGGIETFFSYPTEFIKTKLQLDEKSGTAKQYSGFIDVVRKTIKEKGPLGLYRGLTVILFFSVPKIGIRFGSFEAFKGLAVDEKGNLTSLMRVLCGLGAGISEAILAVTPMETIKVKFIHDQQKKTPQFRGFFSGLVTILKMEGIKGIYQGVVPTILKQGSNQAIRFYVMETLKHEYRGGDSTAQIPKPIIGCFAVVAATASVLGNTPVDVVKTRMQGLDAKKYKNTLGCAAQIWRTEGSLAFYKGTQARLIRVCMDVVFTFMFYESIMEYFDKIWP